MTEDTPTVGERGPVPLKSLRERFGICGGDEVVVREDEGKRIVPVNVVEHARKSEPLFSETVTGETVGM